ncbi:nucleotide-binding alpha-beta plait domain-containing protein [Tanacetum coccineum]
MTAFQLEPHLVLLVRDATYANLYLTNDTSSDCYFCSFDNTPIHETYQPRWDYWGRYMQRLTSRIPIMAIEVDQYKLLQRDLEKVDQGVTLWLVEVWHPPWSRSSDYVSGYCVTVSFSFVVVVGERRKEEERNELNVFLGDDNDSFVSLINFFKSRRSKDWKSTIKDPDEPPLLRSTVIANIHAHDKSYMRQSASPQPVIERKRDQSVEGRHKYERGQPDERSQVKV